MTFMNQFPLFALVLRFKEPSRLPAGTLFELDGTNLRLRVSVQIARDVKHSWLTCAFAEPAGFLTTDFWQFS